MKPHVAFLTILVFTAPLAAAPQPASRADLDFTIKGTPKDKLEIQPSTPRIDLKLRDILPPETEKTEELLNAGKGSPKAPEYAKGTPLESNQIPRPWLPEIAQVPLLAFQPKLKQSKNVLWRLEVTDEFGHRVKTLKGKSIPPGGIEWDGYDDAGQIIKLETLYGYRFLIVDKDDEVLQSTMGESFQLQSMRYDDGALHRIEFSNNYLFVPNKAVFQKDALLGLEKALDIIRSFSSYSFTVELASEDQDPVLLRERGKALTNYLSKALILPENDIAVAAAAKKNRGAVTAIAILKE